MAFVSQEAQCHPVGPRIMELLSDLFPKDEPCVHDSDFKKTANDVMTCVQETGMTSTCCERLVLQRGIRVNLGRKRRPARSTPRRKLLPLTEQGDSTREKAWDQISKLLDGERERNY